MTRRKPTRRRRTPRNRSSLSGRLRRLALLPALCLGSAGLATWRLDPALWPNGTLVLALGLVLAFLGLRWRWRRRGARRLGRLDALYALTPAQFEHAVADLLHRQGYRRVRASGGSGDLGADIHCEDARGAHVIVQCKRYAAHRHVGSREMQILLGALAVHQARGIFATTSTFTAPARDLAQQFDITLLDGPAIVRLQSGRARLEPARAKTPGRGAGAPRPRAASGAGYAPVAPAGATAEVVAGLEDQPGHPGR